MFLFNAAVMGFGKATWMSEVLDCFDTIVRNVANSGRLQQECDILVLRISRCSTKGSVSLPEYKSCMLASLRSLLAKDWDSEHEVAWSWLWENVERLLNKDMGKPPLWEKAVVKLVASLDETTKYALRADIYARFFSSCPAGQDFFKQSTTYLHVIADKVIDMVVDIFKDPVKMVDDISALGLRHVGYAIPTEHFGPFVTACVEVVQAATPDQTTVEAFRWSLGLISKMLVRTITEGSTIVMKAINSNSQKAMRKAISCAPRGQRAMWMLKVQVGSQSISPLEWSLSSGMFQAAEAIIADLLIFRADRDKYYYGAEDLFARHPDIVKNLVDNAPVLLPTLLSGLIWRARTTESGQRRVNYYLKHLLINDDGNFDKAIEWIARAKDPKLVCHPMCVTLSDLVWSGLAARRFLFGKSCSCSTLCSSSQPRVSSTTSTKVRIHTRNDL
jgi:hemoglobin-like flavoprotein